jgi:molecular chaperone DnaK (HSP70)
LVKIATADLKRSNADLPLNRYTGVAYGYRQLPPMPIGNWPEETCLGKIPSDIAYHSKREDIRCGASIQANIRRNQNWAVLRWVKLTLDEQNEGTCRECRPYGEARRMMRDKSECPSDPTDVVSDYLKHIWKHVEREVAQDLGALSRASVEKILVLTVPATWSLQATHRMYEAAKRAGLNSEFRLHILKEPEVAAMHVLLGLEEMKTCLYVSCHVLDNSRAYRVDKTKVDAN